MKNLILPLFIIPLILIAGCRQEDNAVGPLFHKSSAYKVVNNIGYSLSVSKDMLGILDTLDITVTGFNLGIVPDTMLISSDVFPWKLYDANGNLVFNGPVILDNIVYYLVLKPNSSEVLYRMKISMADIFNSAIKPGEYILKGTIGRDITLQLKLYCGKSSNEITDNTGLSCPIYSLKVGDKWTYRRTFYFQYGIPPSYDTVYQSVVGEALINGEKWFLVTSTTSVDQYLTIRKDGVYQYYPDLNTAVLRYKYPATEGESYTSGYEEWNGASLTLVNFQISVDSVNEQVTVQYGNYICNKYNSPEVDANFGNMSTVVPAEDVILSNIGMVRKTDGNVVWELIGKNF